MSWSDGTWTAIESAATAVAALAGTLALVVTVWAFALDQRAKRKEARFGQARLVSAWIESSPQGSRGIVANASDTAVTNAVVWLVAIQGAAWATGEEAAARWMAHNDEGGVLAAVTPETVATVPPGRWAVTKAIEPEGGMYLRWGLEVAFTDRAGRHWIRRGAGVLEEIKRDPATHYGIGQPQDWLPPTAVSG